MPCSLTTPANNLELIVNLKDLCLESNDLNVSYQTQQVFALANKLSLPRLPTRRILGKEPLVDYSNSHVMIANQYLVMLKQKTMDKEAMDKIKELKAKEKQEKRSRRFQDTLTLTEWTIQRIIEKEQRTKFNQTWSTITFKATNECFHNNFRSRFWAHPLSYRRFGLGFTYAQERSTKQQRMARMRLVRHVLTMLQLFSQWK